MPEGNGEFSYRLQGELEQADPHIESLPPTPITPDAKERLESWGMTEPFVTRLQEVASSMRYDLCPQRAERISRNGAFIYVTPEGSEEVILPYFYDVEGRLDGECGGIAKQLLTKLYDTGYVRDLRAAIEEEGKGQITPCLVTGLSRTHFTQADTMTHAWIGLLPEGGLIDAMVTVDASFQEISNTGQNGYQVRECIVDPIDISEVKAASCEVGSGTITDGGIENLVMYPTVLGRSADTKFVYAFSWIKDDRNDYHSLVYAFSENDSQASPLCIGNINGRVRFLDDTELTAGQRSEMDTVCRTLGKLSLIRDQSQAKVFKDELVTTPFREHA